MTCGTCKHFNRHPKYGAGTCQRFPPQLIVVSSRSNGDRTEFDVEQRFPWMESNEVCGEHSVAVSVNVSLTYKDSP